MTPTAALYHLEFTHQRGKTVGRAPTGDHLLVPYLQEWRVWAEAVMAEKGRTFEDPDGYRLELRPSVATPGRQPGPHG